MLNARIIGGQTTIKVKNYWSTNNHQGIGWSIIRIVRNLDQKSFCDAAGMLGNSAVDKMVNH
jgi:hypothetical protein